MKFIVYTCRGTQELCERAREAGFKDVWTPMIKVKRLRQPRNRAPYFEEVWEAAVPGYVYVPKGVALSFRRWCPSQYNASALVQHFGGVAGQVRRVHDLYIQEVVVDLEDLVNHDAAVRGLKRAIASAKPQQPEIIVEQFEVGQTVSFLMGEAVVQGTIEAFRGGGRARLETLLGYFTVELKGLTKVTDQ